MTGTSSNDSVARIALASLCAAIVGLFLWTATLGYQAGTRVSPSDSYYSQLARGFQEGHTYLPIALPEGLSRLSNPYDPTASLPYRMGPKAWLHDLSYYHGRLYLYFGLTPALVLYWPWAALTGSPVSDDVATALFSSLGFLAGAWLLLSVWRRRFSTVSAWTAGACVVALGFASNLPVLLQRPKVYEVAVSCGFAFVFVSLAFLWRSFSSARRSHAWLAASSLAYGFAIGARPSVAFGALILLVPVYRDRANLQKAFRTAAAALAPIALVGLILAAYNFSRFGNPLEFGQHYQLAGDRQDSVQHFSARYVWFNFRVYFTQAVPWDSQFPFVGLIGAPASRPSGHAPIEDPFGILINVPIVWAAMAVFFRRKANERASSSLGDILAALAIVGGTSATFLLFFYGSCSRYQTEFLPEFLVLAGIGILSHEGSSVDKPAWAWAARLTWGLALVYSVAFILLFAAYHYSDQRRSVGRELMTAGRFEAAARQFEAAARFDPANAEAESRLSDALAQIPGRSAEAVAHLRRAAELDPEDAVLQFNLGNALLEAPGGLKDAIAHYEAAIRIEPNYAEAHYNLGVAYYKSGDRRSESLSQFEEALRINPDSEPARRMIAQLKPKGQ